MVSGSQMRAAYSARIHGTASFQIYVLFQHFPRGTQINMEEGRDQLVPALSICWNISQLNGYRSRDRKTICVEVE